MSKEITKAFILQQMQDKFGLRELEPERFTFSETVVPTYEIEQHLKKPIGGSNTLSVTGTGGKQVFAVPDGEVRTLLGYTVIFLAVGAYKVAGGYVTRKNAPTAFVYFDLTKNQTDSYTINLPKPVRLEAGDTFAINVDDYTSTANLQVNYDFIREYTV